ncbi:unnamed protein product [Soboliphyme baturini]|uniref:Proteasome endopeptidase complex n=1 Tax=Soboliphyme baturini TaxID=241478 RepID=A0A183J4L1_9BILA|nr:unnamed protein product [Soboliphyme baturini]
MVYGVISGFMLVAIGEHDGWGRIHQIEYADKAVTEGSATVGIKSSTHAVLVALKRSSHELSGHQKKIYSVDEHIGVSIAGLLSDARLLARFMQSECLSWRWLHQGAMPISLLVSNLQTKMQVNTQRYGRRPFGVGLLIAGYDIHGPHIIQTCPSATSFECYAMSIGARSQSAKTYLEKHMSEFNDSDVKTLVRHALLALRGTLPTEVTLSTKNSSVGIVGKGMPFTVYDQEDVSPYLECISDALSASQESTAATEEPASPMDTAVEVTDEARDS